jgi:hypothetical protein
MLRMMMYKKTKSILKLRKRWPRVASKSFVIVNILFFIVSAFLDIKKNKSNSNLLKYKQLILNN